MDVDSKQHGVVVPKEASVAHGRVLSGADDLWQSYSENPLMVATKAMMSINDDEESSAALALVYDYYKLPREKRHISSSVVDSSRPMAQNCIKTFQLLDLQKSRSMPVNLSLHNPTTVEHQDSKHRAGNHPAAVCESESRTAAHTSLALVKTEDLTVLSLAGISPSLDSGKKAKMVTEQNRVDVPLITYLKDEQKSSKVSKGAAGKKVNDRKGTEQLHCRVPVDCYQYSIEASLSQRSQQADGVMAYLNRGQFYPLTLTRTDLSPSPHQLRGRTWKSGHHGSTTGTARASELEHGGIVQSVIMVVFGEDKSKEEQLKNWKYWHSRQHTAKQRVLDIADYKETSSTIGNVEEIAYNAVSFTWDVSEGAKVFISVNCLSTDFSCQKGVKGMPLVIQVDTYGYNTGGRPVHRALAQIKVFCDKGAERKLRDEEKKQLRKRKGKSSGPLLLPKAEESRLFKAQTDLDTQPVLFIPDVHFGHLQRTGQVFAVNREEDDKKSSVLVKRMAHAPEEEAGPPQPKKARVDLDRKVLLYVRKECDEVFDALMLHSPTLKALTDAILEKYALPVDLMTKVYQRSKKGLLVNMDDNIVQHFANEDTFTLSISSSADSLRVTLSEISM
ncbi:grainyhead-like protein 2 homolog isoform X1 [Synchiropus splendidus]|uniref:grainyhead-like protein 2 homolog isoform X1 n=2 Tax=Synchiropus splendidus TaxID=270530 RepID=UPI00237E65DF|nr:grainyhead-like protein 2 homolog isoform X1 [Synchiropus splendidus]